MSFEWDEAKRLSNRSKHGIDFPYAARIFLDTGRIEKLDDREDYGEDRYTVIGQIDGLIYLVAYTWRRRKRSLPPGSADVSSAEIAAKMASLPG